MFASGPECIVIAAIVVIMEGSVAAYHLVTRHADTAVAAFHEPTQEPVIRLRAARAPFGVVIADTLRGLEEVLADNCRDRYRDPLVTGTTYLALCL
jgi:hypothetical protein